MGPKDIDMFHKILDELYDVQAEIQGYGALLGAIYTQESISGRDLLGPGLRLAYNAQKIQKIWDELDRLSGKLAK